MKISYLGHIIAVSNSIAFRQRCVVQAPSDLRNRRTTCGAFDRERRTGVQDLRLKELVKHRRIGAERELGGGLHLLELVRSKALDHALRVLLVRSGELQLLAPVQRVRCRRRSCVAGWQLKSRVLREQLSRLAGLSFLAIKPEAAWWRWRVEINKFKLLKWSS